MESSSQSFNLTSPQLTAEGFRGVKYTPTLATNPKPFKGHLNPTKDTMTIEITKEAAHKLIGNDEETWRDYKQDELAETSFYYGYGVNIQAIHNWISGVTQYYITDINA